MVLERILTIGASSSASTLNVCILDSTFRSFLGIPDLAVNPTKTYSF